MACDILDDMINKPPTGGTHVTLSTAQEVSCMGGKVNAEQGDVAYGTLMFKEAFTVRGPLRARGVPALRPLVDGG